MVESNWNQKGRTKGLIVPAKAARSSLAFDAIIMHKKLISISIVSFAAALLVCLIPMAIGHLHSHSLMEYIIVFSPIYPSILCLLQVFMIVWAKHKIGMRTAIVLGALVSTILYMILQAVFVVTRFRSLSDDYSDYGWKLMMPILLIGAPALLIGCGIAAIVYEDHYKTSNQRAS